ncbi:hypothetical protein O6H91_08G043200 [Diphasiastrum complanatum]|uniref:Uncharacterized protein n=1 Tax=Diphasiastrum complanatum TaxID=34168 RepID=A0ACC2CX45_DIPCM|nr:hypothetical protein O6H91_08G043200 [Diphasiastrum complanatum]
MLFKLGGGAQRGKNLMNYIVQLFENLGDIIVDLIVGTDTLLHGASSLGRSIVGIGKSD